MFYKWKFEAKSCRHQSRPALDACPDNTGCASGCSWMRVSTALDAQPDPYFSKYWHIGVNNTISNSENFQILILRELHLTFGSPGFSMIYWVSFNHRKWRNSMNNKVIAIEIQPWIQLNHKYKRAKMYGPSPHNENVQFRTVKKLKTWRRMV